MRHALRREPGFSVLVSFCARLKAVDAQITFVREDGRVTKLILHQNGRDAPGRKVK